MKPALGNRALFQFSHAVIPALCLLFAVSGCNTSSTPLPPIQVGLSLTAASVQAGIGTQAFTATMQNDSQNKGVTWSLSGTGCSGATCGSLSANSSLSGVPITYTAPFNQPTPSGVTLTATSVSDTTKSMPAAITVTPAVSVVVSPTPINVQFNAIQFFTATVQNDAAGAGVRWVLSGSSCNGSACGTLSANVSASGAPIKFTGPSGVPTPSSSVTLTATSVTDTARTAPAAITVTPNPGTTAVTISPARAAIAKWQTQTFIATVTGASDMTVSWQVDGNPGGNAASLGTIDAAGKYTPPATGTIGGSHTITAVSNADVTKSAAAPIGVTDLAGVTTYHNDLSRDGANTHEFALTTSSVKTATFGKLFSCNVDGAIYAQPLWVANLTVGATKHNVIVVATQHESVYAFDGDASPCTTLWHVSLVDSSHGGAVAEVSVPSGQGGLVGSGFGDIAPEVGVTGTPVIDPSTNTLYVVSKSVISAGPTFFQRLHALDLATGSEKFGGPTPISGSVNGTAPDAVAGKVTFDPQNQHQRPGLALVNGIVYIAWASHEDHDQYHGWIMGYNASTLAQVPGAVFNTTPNAVSTFSYSRGGIWMAGGAPAADASNSLYLITGNGTYDGITNFGDSILKFSTSSGLALTDWFTPSDQLNLDSFDLDLGSGGAVVLVDQTIAPKHLLIGGGKHGSGSDGQIYVLNRDLLGQFTNTDGGVVQKFPLNVSIFATPAFWQNNLYVAGAGGTMTAFSFASGLFNTTPSSQSATVYGFPGATPSVSSNGSANGIVWAIDSNKYCTPQSTGCGPAVLHAYDATNLVMELWNSSQGASNTAGNAVKFTVPTVANGKVYIGTRGNDCGPTCAVPPVPTIPGELDVYGLLPN